MASRRGYLSQAELAQYADITILDTTEADDQISQAEELIDAYVGFQKKFFCEIITGKAQSGSTTTLLLDNVHSSSFPYTDYFVGCIVEIIGGTNAGQRTRCTASGQTGILTTEAFTSAIDSTSFYKIYQVGKFPRIQDVFINSNVTPQAVYISIPEAIKRAVAAQVEYTINMGTKFFTTDASQKTAEQIMDYSYQKKASGATEQLIAPKAKILLRGIVNRTGELVV